MAGVVTDQAEVSGAVLFLILGGLLTGLFWKIAFMAPVCPFLPGGIYRNVWLSASFAWELQGHGLIYHGNILGPQIPGNFRFQLTTTL